MGHLRRRLSSIAILSFAFILLVAFINRTCYVSYELPPLPPESKTPLYGINAELSQYQDRDLERALGLIEQAGFRWVRQRFPWKEIEPRPGQFHWEKWDRIVEAVTRRKLKLVAVLDTSPQWARSPRDATNPHAPPYEVSDFGRFALAFARRYGHYIDYYQIWDEPNIYPHWGEGYVDPAGYVALLREAYIQIKSADPQAHILTAGLAPTTETGPLNLNEGDYIRGMLEAGAAEFFDILAVKAFGFDSPPEAPPALSRLNFRRAELIPSLTTRPLPPIWVVEIGWNALPPDWSGGKSIWGEVSEEEQALYTAKALRWVQERWPWARAVFLYHLQPDASEPDPRWGFALVWQDGSPRPVYRAVKEAISQPPVMYPGTHRADHPAIRYEGQWRLSPYGADIPHGAQGDAAMAVTFVGTGLDILVRRGDYWAVVYVTVDGQPANALPKDSQGHSYLVLYDPLYRTATIALARGLPYGRHEARLVPHGGWSQWAIVGFRVWGKAPSRRHLLIALAVLYAAALFLLLTEPWVHLQARGWKLRTLLNLQWVKTPPSARLLLPSVFALALLAYLAPPPVALFLLLALFGIIFLYPSAGLAMTAFCIPLFMRTRGLVVREFPVLELSLLLTTGAVALRGLVGIVSSANWKQNLRRIPSRLTGLDKAVLALVVLAALSLSWAGNKGVAIYEFRTVVAESALFYGLIRLLGAFERDREFRRTFYLLTDALILGAMLVSAVGLYQFAAGEVITAEGVRRVRAFYGSPNNLGLFLGRVLPIVIAVALWGEGWRKRAYALAGVPIAAALYLTFSRGAWFLGLPAALAFMGLVRGRKALLLTLAFFIVLGLALLPWLGTERFATTLRLHEGTGFFRLKLWQASLNMLREHPILGVGLDNFLYKYRTRYVLPEAWQELDLSHPHNIILDWWTRLGVGGVAVLGWILWSFFAQGLKLYHILPEGSTRALVLGFVASMVDCVVHGLIDNSFFLPDLAFVFMLSLAVIASLCTMGPGDGAEPQ